MATSLPSSGALSVSTIASYIGLNATTGSNINVSGNTVPLSLRQVFFSPYNTITPSTNQVSMSDFYGCRVAAFSNSTRTSVVSNLLNNTSDGDITIYLGAGSSINGQSGSMYPRNRGLPIKLIFEATSGDLRELNCATYVGPDNKYASFNLMEQGGMMFETVDLFHQIRCFTNMNTQSRFILRIIPMLDGKVTGSGVHTIEYNLTYIAKPPESSEPRR
jgi:hypothetical protein